MPFSTEASRCRQILGVTPDPSFEDIKEDGRRISTCARYDHLSNISTVVKSFEIMLTLLLMLFVAQAFAYETLSISNASLPQSNAPLNYTLAWDISQLYGYNGPTNKLTHSFVSTSCGANLSIYHTDPGVFPDGGTPEHPILLLNHGYPESSYIWRNVTPAVSQRVPVFVCDVCLSLLPAKRSNLNGSALAMGSQHLVPMRQTNLLS